MTISQNNKGFTTTVYHKPTSNEVYSNFNSFIADEYKHDLIFTLLFQVFSIVSDFLKFLKELNYLQDVLKKKYFPTTLLDTNIKNFLNSQVSQEILEHTDPKNELFIVLPYLGMLSLCLRTHKKASVVTFHFVKLKLFLNHQHN